MTQNSGLSATRGARKLHKLIRFAVGVGVLGGLVGLLYWLWLLGYQDRQRDESRAASIKEPPRRIRLPGSDEVLIRLDAATQRRMGLATAGVDRIQWQKSLSMLGFSVVVPHRIAEVRSPWTGVLEGPTEGNPPIVGQHVEKSQVLGVLLAQWSPSDRIQLDNQLRDTRGTIGETEAELQVARNAVDRLRQIGGGAVPQRQTIEAEGNVAKLEARLKAARSREKSLEEVLRNKEGDVRFPFAAPQGGQLTGFHRRPGEVVSAGDLVATIYDPSEVWVAASALPGQLESTEIPGEAELRFPGFQSQPIQAHLVRVNPQVDRQQQALELVYAVSNPQGRISVGLQAVVGVKLGKPEEVLVVSRSAVLQRNEQRLVYVQRGPEDFAKQPVDVVDEDADRVYLRPTLPVGAKVVQQGAQSLLSEEYKESIQLLEEDSKPDRNEQGEKEEK